MDAIAQIENLTLRAAYTNLLKTEPAPSFVAKQTFSLIANYRLNRWNFNLNGYYHDNMQQNAIVPGVGRTTVTLDDYWVWNLTTRYGFTAFDRQFTIEGRVENLFDEGFASPTRIQDFFEGLPNRERTAFLGI
ncbi:MAG: hypothetical protein IID59_10350, partial [Proteobacteria bacterium]|nr:hypothetical protein [Pseudomonadota bacterium]